MTYHNVFWQFHGDMRLMGKAQPQRTFNKRLITQEKVNSKNAKKMFWLDFGVTTANDAQNKVDQEQYRNRKEQLSEQYRE